MSPDETSGNEIVPVVSKLQFLHAYLQFYYISVAVNWYRVRGTEYVIPTIFEVLL